MDFEPMYGTINASLRKQLNSVQATNESTLRTDGVEISKVLSVSAKPVVDSYVVERNGVKVNGVIEYTALYEKIDGMKETVTYTADFGATVQSEDLTNQSVVCLKAQLVDLAVKEVTAERIVLTALIEVGGYAVINNQVKFLDGVSGDVYYQTEQLDYSTLKTKINSTYTTTQEIDVAEIPLRLLHLNANAIVNNVLTAKGYVTVSGVVEYSICYEYAKDDGTDIKDIANTYAFKYEIACDNN